MGLTGSAYQRKLSITDLAVRNPLPILIQKRKLPPNPRFPDTFMAVCHSQSLHAPFLIGKVGV